ncbi:MAG: hypothetical protein HY815_06750 [Candidatus Riflebacteria bacterium]|nr:hypothetical protein [Candidatus Riflebacteria bacterium]
MADNGDSNPRPPAAGRVPVTEAEQLRFDQLRQKADQLIVSGDIGQARTLYRELAADLGERHPLAAEARFHEAMLSETYLAEGHQALQLYLDLARDRHAGSVKALQRLAEAALARVREAPAGAPGRGAREAAWELLEQVRFATPGLESEQRTVASMLAADLCADGQAEHDRGGFESAARLLELAGLWAVRAGNQALAQKSYGRSAATYWYNLTDQEGALRALSGLGAGALGQAAVKAIFDRVTASLVEDLRALVRRGHRREAFAHLARVFHLLVPGHSRTEEVVALYLQELASQYMAACDDRIASVSRRMNQASLELARRSAAKPERPSDKADEVAGSLSVYAFTEEKEMCAKLRQSIRELELSVLSSRDPERFVALQDRARQDKSLAELLDRMHLLALEKMHYRTRYRVEVKDALASLLPRSVSKYVVDDVYQRIRELEGEVRSLEARFLEGAYPKATS